MKGAKAGGKGASGDKGVMGKGAKAGGEGYKGWG